MQAANDNENENQTSFESDWVSAVLVLTWPLGIFAVALGCSFFV
jgi:hypothetical protein